MSGRLTILPKKSYCPWSSKNVEQVLRDERLERERQEKLAQQQQQQESQARWDVLKQQTKPQSQQQNDEKDKDDGPKHINLFEKEEQAFLHQKDTTVASTVKKRRGGITPLFLGQSLSRERERKANAKSKDHHHKEETRKFRMDPMKEFFSTCDNSPHTTKPKNESNTNNSSSQPSCRNDEILDKGSPQRKQKRKPKHKSKRLTEKYTRGTDKTHRKEKRRRRREEDSDASGSSSDDSYKSRKRRRKGEKRRKKNHGDDGMDGPPKVDIADLRRRRLEREELEQQREKDAIREAANEIDGRGSAGRYQNQYYPQLSRK